MPTEIEIRVAVAAQQAEAALRGVASALGQLRGNTETAATAGRGLSEAFKLGEAIDLTGRLNNLIFGLKDRLIEAAKEGVRYNSMLEDSRIAVAGLLRQFDPGRVKTFSQALEESADVVAKLERRAAESPATFEQLLGGLRALSGPAFAAGIRNVDQQIELTVLLSQAIKGIGLATEQLPQEARAILTGNITEDAQLARSLGITRDDIERARSAGQLFEVLTARLGAFKEAGKASQGSLSTQISNLGDNTKRILGEATKGLTDGVTAAVSKANDVLNGVRAKQSDRVSPVIITPAGGVVDEASARRRAELLQAEQEAARKATAAPLQRTIDTAQTELQLNAAILAVRERIVEEKKKGEAGDAQLIEDLRSIIAGAGELADVEKRRADAVEKTVKDRRAEAESLAQRLSSARTEKQRLEDVQRVNELIQEQKDKGYAADFQTLLTLEGIKRAEEARRTTLTSMTQAQREATAAQGQFRGDLQEINANAQKLVFILREARDVQREFADQMRRALAGGDITRQLAALDSQIARNRAEIGGLLGGATGALGPDARSVIATQFGDYYGPDGRVRQDNSDVGRIDSPRTTANRTRFEDLPGQPGIALPTAEVNRLFGDAKQALTDKRRVLVRLDNGPVISLPLIEIGPGASTGAGADLTQEAIRLLGGDFGATQRGAFRGAIRYAADPGGSLEGALRPTSLQLLDKLKDKDQAGYQRALELEREFTRMAVERIPLTGQELAQAREKAQMDIETRRRTAEAISDSKTLFELDVQEFRLRREGELLAKQGADEASRARAIRQAGVDAEQYAATKRVQMERELRTARIDADLKQIEIQKQTLALMPPQAREGLEAEVLRKEGDALERKVQLLREELALKEAQGKPGEQDALRFRGELAQTQLLQRQNTIAQLRASGPLGAGVTGLINFQQQVGSNLQAIEQFVSGSLNVAFNGLQNGITGLIQGTTTWGQVFGQMGAQMLGLLAQLIIKFLVIQGLVLALNAIGSIFGNPGLGTQLLAVISKVPGKRDGGPIGYAGGGWVGMLPFLGGPPNSRDTIPLWGEDGEFMVNKAAAARYRPLLEAINSFRLPIGMPAAFAGGGFTSSRSSLGSGSSFRGGRGEGIIFVDDHNTADRVRRDPRYSRYEVRRVSNSRIREAQGTL